MSFEPCFQRAQNLLGEPEEQTYWNSDYDSRVIKDLGESKWVTINTHPGKFKGSHPWWHSPTNSKQDKEQAYRIHTHGILIREGGRSVGVRKKQTI